MTLPVIIQTSFLAENLNKKPRLWEAGYETVNVAMTPVHAHKQDYCTNVFKILHVLL